MSQRLVRPALAAARRTAPRTAVRTYAAAAEADSKPPVALFGLDGTYASALVRYPQDSENTSEANIFRQWFAAWFQDASTLTNGGT